MAKMTKAQERQYSKLETARRETSDAIFVFGKADNATFGECLDRATPEALAAYDDAREAEDAFERQMISEGRGFRSRGFFYPN